MTKEKKAYLIPTITGLDVAFISDLWTSVAVQGYIAVTGHFITKDWYLVSEVLESRVTVLKHTGCNITLEISQIKSSKSMLALHWLLSNAVTHGSCCQRAECPSC